MRLSRALLIARKEWRELLANKLLMLSMAALPVLFVVMPIVIVALSVQGVGNSDRAKLTEVLKDLPPGLTPQQMIILSIVRMWIGMFLILPVFVPIVIAAQAIVGEKERRTIEPLLASPISTSELLLGKTLASLIPGLLITWVAFGVFCAGIDVIAYPYFQRLLLPDVTWLLALFLVGPMLALLGNGLAVLVSAKVSDARLAQQLAGTAVLPVVAGFVVQVARGVAFGPTFYLTTFAIITVVDLVLYRFAILIFNRERILTSLR